MGIPSRQRPTAPTPPASADRPKRERGASAINRSSGYFHLSSYCLVEIVRHTAIREFLPSPVLGGPPMREGLGRSAAAVRVFSRNYLSTSSLFFFLAMGSF